jgi:hypothetical protein
VGGWVDGWMDGWMDGSKSPFKDCLQQSKKKHNLQLSLITRYKTGDYCPISFHPCALKQSQIVQLHISYFIY